MLFKWIKRSFIGQTRFKWDKQYVRGNWECLKSPLEQMRFDAVRNYIKKYSNKGNILEVGCGEGILQAGMSKHSYRKFLGIDISEIAIQRAAHLADTTTEYRTANMENFSPAEKFDIIIFNEVLYYARNPNQLMARYMEFLNPEGFIIVSIFQTSSNIKVMNGVEAKFKSIDEMVSSNEIGSWCCRVYSKNNLPTLITLLLYCRYALT
ncbi:class I SAM-dependent methyltransferase [Paraflavitalea speifideaquila]|uniref:class I SAM-dependent methyltransferase n=1 Tax=Paraflavitalea speifideaquila TaxID=3076558 RepID=UPI0028F079FE|nr:class I SAM-dependent methyltransferase [Paraflavitalea speifideiaquila]